MNRRNERPAPPQLIAQVSRLYKAILKASDGVFREQAFPLEMDQIPVVMSLYYALDGRSQQEIAQQLHRDKASVNRTIALLARENIVVVIPDKEDKRRTKIALTAAGKALAAKADGFLGEFDALLSAALTAGERKQFQRSLRKLIDAVGEPMLARKEL